MTDRSRISERLLWVYSAAVLCALTYAATKPSVDRALGPPNIATELPSQSAALARAEDGPAPIVSQTPTDREAATDSIQSSELAADTDEPVNPSAELANSTNSQEAETAQSTDALGLLSSGFELTENGSRTNDIEADNAGNIEVRKSVYLGGAAIGTIPVTIDPNAQLLLDSRDIRNLLSGQAGIGRRLNTLPEEGLVSFQRLRNSGIDLRYSPTGDRIVLSLT